MQDGFVRTLQLVSINIDGFVSVFVIFAYFFKITYCSFRVTFCEILKRFFSCLSILKW